MSGITVRSGPFAFVERQLEALSPRDRKLLVGMFVFFGVVGVGLLWYTLYGFLDDKASRVRDAKTKLETIQMLQAEYAGAAGDVKAQEDRLREYQRRPVSAYIEEIATRRGVIDQLRQVNQSSAEIVGNLKQTKYTVELKRADYSPLFQFLYDLETEGFPASVESAKFKTSYEKRERKLDLTLDLVVFSLAEGSG